MVTRLIVACLVFVSILLVLSYARFGSSRVVAADEQAVIVNIKVGGEMGNSEERKRIAALEEQLAAVIKESGAGDFDGDEFGKGVCTLYMYGPSADRLFSVVQPTLKKFRASSGSYVVKRYGKPGAKQERVEIGVDDTPQPK
jgi:hypothetical protein